MAKPQRAKAKPTSLHSRAARRAASPSLDIDKSLKSLPRAETTVIPNESVLHGRTNAGITKKQSKAQSKSRAQRLRQQKGIERAEAVLDRMEKKVAKSVDKSKTVKARRTDWDDLNRKVSKFETLQMLADVNDGENENAMVDGVVVPVQVKNPAPKPTVLAQTAQQPGEGDHADIDIDDDIT